jgi:hypothetical protein
MGDLNIGFASTFLIGKINCQEKFFKSSQRGRDRASVTDAIVRRRIELRQWGNNCAFVSSSTVVCANLRIFRHRVFSKMAARGKNSTGPCILRTNMAVIS